ncbi:MAG TPA: dihydrodipicolinate synthase family protein [Stellaceae bacterium]|nr:dihydrodipicolinate synthase family protein [Stellaceae bacterium]
MKTTPVTKADIERSVLAVPPMARHADFSLNVEANRALIRYLEAGGIRTLMYGGNANVYHLGVLAFESEMGALAELAGADTWVIPSVGPEYGKAMDQAQILKALPFPTVMVLPMGFPATPAGVAIGIRKIAERYGKPVIAYVKAENYLKPADAGALIRDGAVVAIKYGVVRKEPATDAYLSALLDHVDPEKVVSGIGERPAPAHLIKFGLVSFTSGSVCVAPRLSLALLAALKADDEEKALQLQTPFLPLEDLRDALSPIRTLHSAVTLSGIADMGPMLPMLTEIEDPAQRQNIERAARVLRAKDEAYGDRKAA